MRSGANGKAGFTLRSPLDIELDSLRPRSNFFLEGCDAEDQEAQGKAVLQCRAGE